MGTNTARVPSDVYHDWLGIPPDKCPPNYYDLLGVELFEPSDAVIRRAAFERMKIVRPRCLKHRELATQVLNEIAKARVCLCDAARKSDYDNALRTGDTSNVEQRVAAEDYDLEALALILDPLNEDPWAALSTASAAKHCTLCRKPVAAAELFRDDRGRAFHRACFSVALDHVRQNHDADYTVKAECSAPACARQFEANKLPPPDRDVPCPACGEAVRFFLLPKHQPPPAPAVVDDGWFDDALGETSRADQYTENRNLLKQFIDASRSSAELGRDRVVQLVRDCLAARPDRCPCCDERILEAGQRRCYACNLDFETGQQVDAFKETMRQMIDDAGGPRERPAGSRPQQEQRREGKQVETMSTEELFRALYD